MLIAAASWGWRFVRALTASTYQDLLNALYEDSVPRLLPSEIKQLERYAILDTRSESEYQVSHLKGAQFVDYKAPDWEALEALDKTQPVLVYCSVGYRSERIGEALLERGFERVYNLHGGIFEWVNTGKTVVKNTDTPVQAVHGYAPRWGKWITAPIKVVYN